MFRNTDSKLEPLITRMYDSHSLIKDALKNKMPDEKHPLEQEYGLTKEELLDAISRRFRAKVTLEGAVAEVHLGKHIKLLQRKGFIAKYEEHDLDAYPDYSIWLPSDTTTKYLIECKNVRDADEAYRKDGQIIAYKVETQKTRSSKGDRSSRYYSYKQFDILAVCLGKKTHDWKQFMFIQSKYLAPHPLYKEKIAVMHEVPLPTLDVKPPWYSSLEILLKKIK